MKKLLMIAMLIGAVGVSAQIRGGLHPECRREVLQLCLADARRDRDRWRTCLVKNGGQLSQACRGELRGRMAEQGAAVAASLPAGGTDYGYGPDPLQHLTFWAARDASTKAPLIIFVHGGGWKRGDMKNATGKSKIAHLTGLGYAFASINYRLVPAARVEDQARDVAASIAFLKSNAARIGFDGGQIVLMGHSAGAHLSALVGTDERYLRAEGLTFADLRGVIPIDGAAYDVPAQMKDGPRMMQDTYRQAFGVDPVRQHALSPTAQATSAHAPPFLLLHVQRADGIRQATELADAIRKAGTAVQINGFEGKGLAGHMAINRKLGEADYPATPVLDAWLGSHLRR